MGRPDNHNWVFFFAVLVALGTAAVVIPIVYNLGLQLTPEQVEHARQRWQAAGLANYDLDYQQKYTHSGQTVETTYRVIVRNRCVIAVFCDGELTLLTDSAKAALGLGPWTLSGTCGARNVDGMFDYIEAFLREESMATRRNYATATFDQHDGHPTRYVRRVRGGAERLEWTVKLTHL